MTNEDINNYLRLAIMEEVNKCMGKNFECVNDLIDYAKILEKENEQLKQQIEKMKCCESCKHHVFWGNELKCVSLSHDEQSECDKSKHKWELAE